MKVRTLWGWILASTALGSIMFGGLVFPLILGWACYIGGNEFITMAQAKGYKPSVKIVRGMIISFFALTAIPSLPGLSLPPEFAHDHFPILLTVGICISFFRLLFRTESPPASIADIASTIMGFIYVGWLPSHLVMLRNLSPPGVEAIANPLQQPGFAYVWAGLFIIWATDVFAYYVGKRWGKHKLHPEVSPKKTVEGALGGLMAAVFWATVVVYLADNYLFPSHPFQYKLIQAPLLGIVVSLASQLGDLCESLMKRDAGMKDSSNVIPGHGGMLDRGDSMIFGGPIAYYWIKVVVLGIV
ncbi:MAG: phosphatidate cytidylyltransferase [Cyanobacteria bacterium HKST-UBA02]|nr:phosphatidate cytidylyltransferase [Cyanobacteria bacterium HKST-UBA02]